MKKNLEKRLASLALILTLVLALTLAMCLPAGGALSVNAEELGTPTDETAAATEPSEETQAATEASAQAETEAAADPTNVTEAPTDPTDVTETPADPTNVTEAPTDPTDATEDPTDPTDPTEATTDPTDPTEPPAETEAPAEPQLVQCELEAEDEKTMTQVTVAGVFPEGATAELKLQEITNRMDQLLDLPQDSSVVVYTVTVYDAQGAKFETTSPVTVTIRLADTLPVDDANLDSLKVIRVVKDETGEAVTTEEIEKVETSIQGSQAEAEFKTDSLSTFVLTWTDPTVETEPVVEELPDEEVPLAAPAAPEEIAHIEGCTQGCTDEGCACTCHSLFGRLMACTTLDEIDELIDSATEEELASISEEQWTAVDVLVESLEPEPLPPVVLETSEPPVKSEIVSPTVDYTNVAPFKDPVVGGR